MTQPEAAADAASLPAEQRAELHLAHACLHVSAALAALEYILPPALQEEASAGLRRRGARLLCEVEVSVDRPTAVRLVVVKRFGRQILKALTMGGKP